MRIATWNINGIRARTDYVAGWLDKRQPDLVGLQELKATDSQFPHDFFTDLGYRATTHGQPQWNGVAWLCKQEHENSFEIIERGLPNHDDDGARLITGLIGDLAVTNVYCLNGREIGHEMYGAKLRWFDGLLNYCRETREKYPKMLLCGDFNIVHQALDSYKAERGDGEIFHSEPERAKLNAFCSDGWTDLFRAKYPEERAFSWWDFRRMGFPQNKGLRIDLILGTRAVVENTVDVVIDRDFRKKIDGLTASDHAPVYVDLSE